jgi:hypothetical protein
MPDSKISTNPNPIITNKMEKTLARGVAGVISPYPIVHMVTIQKYSASTIGCVESVEAEKLFGAMEYTMMPKQR